MQLGALCMSEAEGRCVGASIPGSCYSEWALGAGCAHTAGFCSLGCLSQGMAAPVPPRNLAPPAPGRV